jgi:hypothetical protein
MCWRLINQQKAGQAFIDIPHGGNSFFSGLALVSVGKERAKAVPLLSCC